MKIDTMRRILLITTILTCGLSYAAQDSTYTRTITVERDYQPTIQEAQKIQVQPEQVEETMTPVEVRYSEYTPILSPDHNLTPISTPRQSWKTSGQYNGYVRAGFGHTGTLLDLEYTKDDTKKSLLDVYAHHRAEWGLRALSKTKLGIDFTHRFQNMDVYFGVNGGNIYYHKYGRLYDYTLGSGYNPNLSLTADDKTALWTAEAFVGIRSNRSKADLQYRLQTGYQLFAKIGAVAEHQVRTHAMLDWHSEAHHVGGNLSVQNNILQVSGLSATIPAADYNSRHAIRIEPYYEYRGQRINLHAGVNLDLNIGAGQMLSGAQNVSFAPSPNISLEAQVAKQWLTLYATAQGHFGVGSLQDFMESNRYRLIHSGIVSDHVAAYTPIDAELGLHISPISGLLLELHGGYALQKNQTSLIATTADGAATYTKYGTPMNAGCFSYAYSDYGRGKVGALIDYHYRDIVHIRAWGDYYMWQSFGHETPEYTFTNPAVKLDSATVYDRAKWTAGLRIDGRIDSHWSLYSDNRFTGSRLAMATDGAHLLRPIIEIGLGCKYEMAVGKRVAKRGAREIPNLELFLQLDNIIHRYNQLYYGYETQGIQFLLGGAYKF